MQTIEAEIEMTCGVSVNIRAEYRMYDGDIDELYIYQAETNNYLTLPKSDEDQVRHYIEQVEH